MATRGYSSYHGRARKAKILTAVVLIAVIVTAVGYLVAQNYIVYDDNGKAVLSLPHRTANDDKAPKVTPEDVTLEIAEPEEKLLPVAALHATQLVNGALKWAPTDVLAGADECMIIEVKRINGGITYTTQAEVPQEVFVEQGDTLSNLKALLADGRYTVAKMSALCDSYFVRTYHDAAFLLENGSYWYDAGSWTWLNPSDARVAHYLTGLCKDYAALGFDEIMLDYFSYPTTGWLHAIALDESVDRVAALRTLAETIREELPESIVLSVVVRSDVIADYGLSVELLTDCFDRVYIAPYVDASGWLSELPEDYDRTNRIVQMYYTKPESGNYAVMRNDTDGFYTVTAESATTNP